MHFQPTRLWRRSPSLRDGIVTLVHSNVFIALAAASVSVTTAVLAGLSLTLVPPFVVFAVTMFVYSANRFLDLRVDEHNVPGRAAFTRQYGRYCLAAGVTLYAVAVTVALALDVPGAPGLLVPVLVTALYSRGGLQRVPLVKNLLVGVSWGLIPLGVGVYAGALWQVSIWALFGWVSCSLTVAAMVFDVKDIPGDRAAGVRTIPVCLGPATTRRLAQGANLLVGAVVVGAVATGVLGPSFLVLLAVHLYVAAYVAFATPDRGPLFYGFVVDGEHLFLAFLVLALDALVPAFGG